MTENDIAHHKQWIDAASYKELLTKWRFEPTGSEWFQPPLGDYFAETMKRKKAEIPHEKQAAASKELGRDR